MTWLAEPFVRGAAPGFPFVWRSIGLCRLSWFSWSCASSSAFLVARCHGAFTRRRLVYNGVRGSATCGRPVGVRNPARGFQANLPIVRACRPAGYRRAIRVGQRPPGREHRLITKLKQVLAVWTERTAPFFLGRLPPQRARGDRNARSPPTDPCGNNPRSFPGADRLGRGPTDQIRQVACPWGEGMRCPTRNDSDGFAPQFPLLSWS
jgi:hypothetical protein